MRVIKSIIFLFVVSVFCSCKSKANDQAIVVTFTQSEEDIFSLRGISDGYEIIVLQSTSPESFITRINRVAMDDDRIFIHDRIGKRVVAFDSGGEFVASTANMVGRGPNEYIHVIDIAVDEQNKHLLVHTDIPSSMMIFDYDLNLIDRIDLDYYFWHIAVDDGFFYGVTPPHEDNFLVTAKLSDIAELKSISDYTALLPAINQIAVSVGSPAMPISTSNGKVYVGRKYDNNIYELDDGEIKKIYSFDFGDKNLPKSYKNRTMTRQEFDNVVGDNYVWSTGNIVSSEDYLFFNTNLLGVMVLDKRTNECRTYRRIVGGASMSSPNITSAHSADRMIFIPFTASFTFILDAIAKGEIPRDESNEELVALAEKAVDGNPVLIVYKLR